MASWLLQLAYAAAVARGDSGARVPVTLVPVTATCRSCHQRIVDNFTRTAHATTTTPAGAATVKGDFSAGRNVLRTRNPRVWFRISERRRRGGRRGEAPGRGRAEREDRARRDRGRRTGHLHPGASPARSPGGRVRAVSFGGARAAPPAVRVPARRSARCLSL